MPSAANTDGTPSFTDFEGWENDDIKGYMREWFFELFCDPVEETPYVDGEYFFPWGGPYNASDELHDAFGRHVHGDLIDQLVEELESEFGLDDWAPTSNHPDQLAAADEYHREREHEEWLSQNDPLTIFKAAKDELQAFVAAQISDDVTTFKHRMAFVQAWAMLEAFLSDAMLKGVRADSSALAALYKKVPELSVRKFGGEELLREPELPTRTAIEYLEKQAYHALTRVIPQFEAAFGSLRDAKVDISEPMKILVPLVDKRHDCVHRNGKTVRNEAIEIARAEILSVLNAGFGLAQKITELMDLESRILRHSSEDQS